MIWVCLVGEDQGQDEDDEDDFGGKYQVDYGRFVFYIGVIFGFSKVDQQVYQGDKEDGDVKGRWQFVVFEGSVSSRGIYFILFLIQVLYYIRYLQFFLYQLGR